MRSCWFGALLVAVATAGAPAPASARTPAERPPAGAPAARDVPPLMIAKYGFNGRSGSILDESGHGHTLSLVAGHGGWVRPVVHGPGTALAFPSKCTVGVCPHAALQSPSSADLNPGTRDIAYGADVLLPVGQTSKGQNIVQKGYSTTSSQWKLQIDGAGGRPSCVLVDDRKPTIRIVTSAVSVADGRWHAVQCRRAGPVLVVSVDNVERGAVTVPARLSVTNSRPLSIGAKGAYDDNDQFNGALDNVWVQIG